MESALVAWIVDCSKNNVFLNKTIIGAKALSSYKLFDKENDQNSAELKTIPRICCQRSQVVRSLRNHFLLADGGTRGLWNAMAWKSFVRVKGLVLMTKVEYKHM